MTVIGHGYDDNVGAPAFRNVIINGGMSVNQRGTTQTSLSSVSGGYYTADRWSFWVGTLGTHTNSIENDAPTGSGFRKSFKTLVTTNASTSSGSFLAFAQKIEGQNIQHFCKGTSNAKPFALSFWVKANVTGTYIVELNDENNSRSISQAYTITASGVWEKKTLIFSGDTVSVFLNDSNSSLGLFFWLGAGSSLSSGTLQTSWGTQVAANRAVGQVNLASAVNNYWQITGVQLEAGPVATPFEFLPFGDELRRCQRYYYKNIGGAVFSPNGTGFALSTTQAIILVNTPVPLRSASGNTIESANVRIFDGAAGPAVTSLTIDWATPSVFSLIATVASGLTIYRPCLMQNNNNAAGYYAIGAEL